MSEINQQDETIYWIDPTNGDIWERTGYCSQCGDCCDDSENLFANQDGNWIEGNGLTQQVHGKCAYFSIVDGKGFCSGRDTQYYLNGCKSWPSKPQNIATYQNCTYKFTKIN